MLNWNRQLEEESGEEPEKHQAHRRRDGRRSAISMVQPACRLKANHWNHCERSRKPSRARRATTSRSGVKDGTSGGWPFGFNSVGHGDSITPHTPLSQFHRQAAGGVSGVPPKPPEELWQAV